MTRKAVTLPEIAAGLFIIAAITIVAVPRFLSETRYENEVAAMDVLTKIHAAQQAFRTSTGSSYGFLGELIGREPRRDAFVRFTGPLTGLTGEWHGDVLHRDGYCFTIYLPDARKFSFRRPPEGVPIEADAWIAYAWPETYGHAGRHVYAIDWKGRLWSHQNAISTYQGTTVIPPAELLASALEPREFPFLMPGKSLLNVRWESVPRPR